MHNINNQVIKEFTAFVVLPRSACAVVSRVSIIIMKALPTQISTRITRVIHQTNRKRDSIIVNSYRLWPSIKQMNHNILLGLSIHVHVNRYTDHKSSHLVTPVVISDWLNCLVGYTRDTGNSQHGTAKDKKKFFGLGLQQ